MIILKVTDFVSHNQSTVSLPNRFALIIGAMKAGTTSLFEILSQHPQICPSKKKEPDYFINDRDNKSHEDYIGLWDWKSELHTVALESSVAYTKMPFISGVPERICKSGLGQFRFIYMLRDPLTRIESQARHALFAGWGKPLDAGISEDLIYFSRYAMQLDHYLKYFSKDDVMLMTLEEFQSSPEAVLARICTFLEIDNKFQFSEVTKPRNSGEFFNTSPFMARITQGEVGQFIAQHILPAKTKRWLREYIAKFGKGKEEKSNIDHGRWRLNPEERIFVLNELSEDLRRLESEFNVDVWKYWHVAP